MGSFFAPWISGRLMDWNFRRVAKKLGITIDRKRDNSLKNFPIERVRIAIAVPLILIGDAALLCYGWAINENAPLAGPLVLPFIISLTLTGAFNALCVMLIDFYPLSPSTATAANNLVRCLMGAGGTAVIIEMIEAMGRDWCFTFVAAVVFFASPILWILVNYGPGWREARRVREEEAKARKANAS